MDSNTTGGTPLHNLLHLFKLHFLTRDGGDVTLHHVHGHFPIDPGDSAYLVVRTDDHYHFVNCEDRQTSRHYEQSRSKERQEKLNLTKQND